jgi:hypothetical protein
MGGFSDESSCDSSEFASGLLGGLGALAANCFPSTGTEFQTVIELIPEPVGRGRLMAYSLRRTNQQNDLRGVQSFKQPFADGIIHRRRKDDLRKTQETL